jgi:mono/diheme cytochrome c family protein
MSGSKTPKVLFLLLILVLAGALVVSGCGGGGSSSSTTTEEGMSEAEARSGEGSLAEEGKTVFTTTCGSCHTLKAAGTSGEVGPNLDELEPDLATVEHQVVNGGGGMPAFGKEGILNAKEIKAVATYVSSVAGQG